MNESAEAYMQFGKLPILGKQVRDFDRAVGEEGLQKAVMDVVRRTGSRLEVRGVEGETERILAEEPVLLVGNHPYDAEPIPLIATLPPRDDVSILGIPDAMGIGPNLTKHLIPVYVGRHAGESQKLSARLGKAFTFSPRITAEEAMERNRQSLAIASEKIKKGGMVILFPEGVRGKGGKWFSGIGHLLREIGVSNGAYLVNAYVEGTSDFDVFRLVPGIRRAMPPVKVSFSKPQEVSEILSENISRRKLTEELQAGYDAWVQSLLVKES